MGILDDAIKEHLELKRQHGADDSELKQLEDEAFGAAERPGEEGSTPDPIAEAPTEFMAQPDLEESPEGGAAAEALPEPVAPEAEEASGRPSPRSEIADLQEAPPSAPPESAPEPEEPAEEEAPAMEHEAITGPSTAEREAIAEQPTEMYDVEEELTGLDETETEVAEVKDEEDEFDDFWDEKRLSDELDQALEAPSDVEDEESVFEDSSEYEDEAEAGEDEAEAEAEENAPPARPDEDVLEETPDFLEETPEDDQLWFEQKPPKDFDFDD
ncbi:MAG: hypothetical protein WA687_11600 [Solirubrobacterales bacterium]